MKRILLVRHATAVSKGRGGSDFHRKLKKSGRREAAVMAEKIAGITPAPDVLLSSPADRALETAYAFADQLERPRGSILQRDELYGGLSPEELLEIVRGTDEGAQSLAVFGHNPSFSEFASFLLPDFDRAIPRAGVVIIDVDHGAWQDVKGGDGVLVAFEWPLPPEEQERAERELLDRISTGVRTAVLTALREQDIAESREIAKAVERAGERIAEAAFPFARAAHVRAGGSKAEEEGKKQRARGKAKRRKS